MAKKIRVERGHLYAEAATKTEAKADLEKQIDWALTQSGPTIECRFGLLLFISAAPSGWQYSIVAQNFLPHGQQYHSSCCLGHCSYVDALQAARGHAAQNAWHSEIEDDEAHITAARLLDDKSRDLRHWIKWQRSYGRLIAAGHTKNEAFELAGRAA